MTTQLGTFVLIGVVVVVWVLVKKIRGPQAPHEPRFGGAPHNPEDPTVNPNER